MKPSVVFIVLGVSTLLISCASKPSYQDASGRKVEDVASYRYSRSAQSAPAADASLAGGEQGFGPIEQPWPKTVVSGNVTNVIYQLQIDSWDGSAVTGRHAVAVQAPGQAAPAYGVIQVRATTTVNKEIRTVSFLNVQVTDGNFPSAVEREEELLQAVREGYPRQVQVVSLDSLEATLAANAAQQKVAAAPLNNEAPSIIFSETPAVLLYIDGEPVWKEVGGTDLMRLLNTRYLVLRDNSGGFYLHTGGFWMRAEKLDAEWTDADPPSGWEAALKQAQEAGHVDVAVDTSTNTAPTPDNPAKPKVYVSTGTSELIVTDGPPNYVPIAGTELLYVTNTTGNVFKHLGDQQNYVLLAGRWYKSSDFSGPWTFVPGNQLPQDFAKIPDDSPKENVKASVPGTAQAKEALIANSIPQTTAIPRTSQMQDPQIDGPPRLEPISGTPLHYVANSGTPIIQVDEKTWYACQNGVWYAATSVEGPWTVASTVPEVIYTIPPSSPMHYVTYVRVYDSTGSVVYQGYTQGYMGTVVDSGAVVVYGTGYYYRPWVGSVWYGAPITWGLGWGPSWAPWSGWYYGVGFGWYSGYHFYAHRHWHHHHYAYYPRPWYGPYRYRAHELRASRLPTNWGNTSRNIYARAPRTAVAAPLSAMNRTPVYAQSYNSKTGAAVAGQQAEVQNVLRRPSRDMPPVRGADPAAVTARQSRPDRSADIGQWRPATSIRNRGVDAPARPGPVFQQSRGAAPDTDRPSRSSPPDRLGGFEGGRSAPGMTPRSESRGEWPGGWQGPGSNRRQRR